MDLVSTAESSIDGGKYRDEAFSEISLLPQLEENPGSHHRSGSLPSSRELERTPDGPPKSEAELMGIFLRSPKKSDGKYLASSGKPPFSLEEEDIERVLGLIESLEARNTFLSQNLQFRDAEYQETRNRLEELEDVLTVVTKDDVPDSTLHASSIEQLKAREIELEAAYWRLAEMQKETDLIKKTNKVR